MTIPKPTPPGLKQNYLLYFESALILSLTTFIVLTKIHLPGNSTDNLKWNIPEQEILHLEGMLATSHITQPPAPPVYRVPNPRPQNVIIEERLRNLDIEFPLYDAIPLPQKNNTIKKEPIKEREIPIEDMPKLIGGMEKLQRNISYPRKAIRDKVEGRVILEFTVDPKGKVRNPRIVKGVRDDINKEAIRAISKARFLPGRKQGKPIPVKHFIYIRFEIQNKSK